MVEPVDKRGAGITGGPFSIKVAGCAANWMQIAWVNAGEAIDDHDGRIGENFLIRRKVKRLSWIQACDLACIAEVTDRVMFR